MKHGHKGTATKHEQLRETPLVEMTQREFDAAWDGTGAGISRAVLDEARDLLQDDILIAMVVLRCPGEPDCIAHYAPEFGDDEGAGHMREFIKDCKRARLLKPGESLRLEMRRIGRTAMRLDA